jgi:hypothetical protein
MENKATLVSTEVLTSYLYEIDYDGRTYSYVVQIDKDGDIVTDIIRDKNGYEIDDPTLAENIVGFWEQSGVEFPAVV